MPNSVLLQADDDDDIVFTSDVGVYICSETQSLIPVKDLNTNHVEYSVYGDKTSQNL